eukprot:TRINITY_DN18733_c0_g1_i1.p1 TRINITY_DN18733_c0_g1~~TRINITY_DN18733_c0_g1_i1.p1  ORF type:complete len:982 (+),score=204.26 TRINITY_DN18733_c0_g1_i1:401-2947(+)
MAFDREFDWWSSEIGLPELLLFLLFAACSAAIVAPFAAAQRLWLLAASIAETAVADRRVGERDLAEQLQSELGIGPGGGGDGPVVLRAAAELAATGSAPAPGPPLPPPATGLGALPASALCVIADHEDDLGCAATALWLRLVAAAAESAAGPPASEGTPDGAAEAAAAAFAAASGEPTEEGGVPGCLRLAPDWEAGALLAALGHRTAGAAVFRAAATRCRADLRWLASGERGRGVVSSAGALMASYAEAHLGTTAAGAGGAPPPPPGEGCCAAARSFLGDGVPLPPWAEDAQPARPPSPASWGQAVELAARLGPRAASWAFHALSPPADVLAAEGLRHGAVSACSWPLARAWAFHYAARRPGVAPGGWGAWCEALRSGAAAARGELRHPPGGTEVVDIRLGPISTNLGVSFDATGLTVQGWRLFAVDGEVTASLSAAAAALGTLSYGPAVLSWLADPRPRPAEETPAPNLALLAAADFVAGACSGSLPASHVRLHVAPAAAPPQAPETGSAAHPFGSVARALSYAHSHFLHATAAALRLALLPGEHRGIELRMPGAAVARLLVLEGCPGSVVTGSAGAAALRVPAERVVLRRLVVALPPDPGIGPYPSAALVAAGSRRLCVCDVAFVDPAGGSAAQRPVAELPDPAQGQVVLCGVWLPRRAGPGFLRRSDDCMQGYPSSASTAVSVCLRRSAVLHAEHWARPWAMRSVPLGPRGKDQSRRVLLLAGEPATAAGGHGGVVPRITCAALYLFFLVGAGLFGDASASSCEGIGIGGPCAAPLAHAAALVAAILGLSAAAFALRGRVLVLLCVGSAAYFAADSHQGDRPGSQNSQGSETARLRRASADGVDA